jgi:hypothetical protein
MEPQKMTAEELDGREYQEAVIGVLMQCGIIGDDGVIDDDQVIVSAYEDAVALLVRDGFIVDEQYRGFLGLKKTRRVFSYEKWRVLRDRIASLQSHFNIPRSRALSA